MRRTRRWLPLVVVLAGLVGAIVVDAASASGDRPGLRTERPYREGPLEQRGSAFEIVRSPHGEELLVLGGIAAILAGLRASGLTRQRPHATAGRRRRVAR